MSSAGVVNGCADGALRLHDTIKRTEVVCEFSIPFWNQREYRKSCTRPPAAGAFFFYPEINAADKRGGK
ncbi:hypothetical protein [Paenibacillus thailandensis]|uniref:Spore coat associated protein CotJA n=1 Tax=Paenibacillus thailandensis TaxID=393250 RepID=A0ABW5QZV5_9BACL